MTFETFKRCFNKKYPDGGVSPRGKFGGAMSDEVAVWFKDCGKVYFYRDGYGDILLRLGISVIERKYVERAKAVLQNYIDMNNGKYRLFGKTGGYEKQIEDYKKLIHEYETEYEII